MQKIVVALTSYPMRINGVYKVIKSLWTQKKCADEIILYLSTAEFPYKEADMPKELLSMLGKNGFRIEWVEGNLKSHKKYYYVLQNYQDDIVITVDDDVIYDRNMINDLLKSYEKFPNAVLARRARIILKNEEAIAEYKEWDGFLKEYANQPRMDLCAIGVGGVLYPPMCATKDWFVKDRIKNLAENQDDLWLKYNEVKNRIPVVYIGGSSKDIHMENEDNTLCEKNLYGGENDSCIQKLISDAKKLEVESYTQWFIKLMQKGEYILQKKQYYRHKTEELFARIQDKPVYLYGAGQRAGRIIRILDDFNLKGNIKNIIVSNKLNNPSELDGIAVCSIDEVDSLSGAQVICGVSNIYIDEVSGLLKQYECEMVNLDVDAIIHYYF